MRLTNPSLYSRFNANPTSTDEQKGPNINPEIKAAFLPDELLMYIFSLLRTSENQGKTNNEYHDPYLNNVANCALVCRRWYAPACQILYSNVSISGVQKLTKFTACLARNHALAQCVTKLHLTYIVLNNNNDSSFDPRENQSVVPNQCRFHIRQAFDAMVNLSQLTLEGRFLISLFGSLDLEHTQSLRNLTHLRLTPSQTFKKVSIDLKDVAPLITLPALENLYIDNMAEHSVFSDKQRFEMLLPHSALALKHLHLSCMGVNLVDTLQLLFLSPALESLTLICPAGHHIFSAASSLPIFNTINLSQLTLKWDSFAYSNQAWSMQKFPPNLTSLSLGCSKPLSKVTIPSSTIESIPNNNLEFVSFTDCKLSLEAIMDRFFNQQQKSEPNKPILLRFSACLNRTDAEYISNAASNHHHVVLQGSDFRRLS